MTILTGVQGDRNLNQFSYDFLLNLHRKGLNEYDPRFESWDEFKTLIPNSFQDYLDVFEAVFNERNYSRENSILKNIQIKNTSFQGYNIVEAYYYLLFSMRNNSENFEFDPFESIENLCRYFESMSEGEGSRFAKTAERIRKNIELESDNIGTNI